MAVMTSMPAAAAPRRDEPAAGARTHAALFCLGLWVMGTVWVSVVATQNFFTIDRLLAGPSHEEFTAFVATAGRETARPVLRYLSSELNRLFFTWWNAAQLGIGAATLWLVWRLPDARRLKLALAAMLLVVVVLAVGLTPPIVAVGRSLDFVPRDPLPPAMATFGVLHAAYTTLELLKGGAAMLVAAWLIRRAR